MSQTDLCVKIKDALDSFLLKGQVEHWEPYGTGHINDTFLVITKEHHQEYKYIVQRMNHFIFKDLDGLMNNMVGVTSYLRKKIVEHGGNPDRETLNVVKTKMGEDYFRDSIGCSWRCCLFIDDAIGYDKVEKPEDFYESGKAFGNFQGLLAEYPAETLVETIPNFHNTPSRFQALLKAAEKDVMGRVVHVTQELEFIKERQQEFDLALRMHEDGLLPYRVTHNDTKLNNILIDNKTGTAICIIDLDTIMPGFSINDFGDSIRFGANTAAEDETDLSKVSLSLPLYEVYTKGFLEGCQGRLSDSEIQMLPMGAKLMTMECGIRFLADYLEGDVYFKIEKEAHNLDRCRTQLALVKDMECKWDEMVEIINDLNHA